MAHVLLQDAQLCLYSCQGTGHWCQTCTESFFYHLLDVCIWATLSSYLSYSVHDQADLVQAGGRMDKEIPCMLSSVSSTGLALDKSLIFFIYC